MSKPQAPATKSRYVDARVTIHSSRRDKGFAFGTATIDGVTTEVFVGSRGNATKDGNGRWEITNKPVTPSEGDYLDAKICTEVDPGKKPFAAFWQVISTAYDDIDDGGGFESFEDVDVDETPCQWCSCWPCRCEPEY
jgi:hypothetical protein